MGAFDELRDKTEDDKVIIRRLSPKLCGDWLNFFDRIAFEDHGEWGFCYCLEGHLDPRTHEKWTDPKERREKAVELIQKGEMQGYLAYLGNTVAGWCNVNDRENYRYVTEMFRKKGYPAKEPEGTKVKSIYCFLVAPEHRGKGIAQSLLNRVCQDAAKDGYTYIEAYPFGDDGFEYQYHGTARMYQRSGFTETADLNYVKIMRKTLTGAEV